MATAVRERDAPRVIQLLRRRVTELSQESLARMCGVAQSTVTRAEAGKGLTDRRKAVEALRGLGAPLGLQGTRKVEIHQTQNFACASPTPSDAKTMQPSPEGTAGFGSFWCDVMEGSESDAISAFRAADRQVGGTNLYALVMHYLTSRVGPTLVSDSSTPDTFVAAAGLTEMAGWMAHDAGRDEVATRHFHRAQGLAQAGEVGALIAQVWASRAHLALHRDDAETALVAAERAWRHLEGSEDTALRGRILAMLTRAYAARGEASASRDFLRRAEHLLSVPISTPGFEWTSPFDAGSLASEAARSLCDLGDYTAAVEHAQRALGLRSHERVRARALASLTLARALLGKGQVTEAALAIKETDVSVAEMGSAVTTMQLQDVRAALASYRDVPEVATVLSEPEMGSHSPARGRGI